MEVLGKGDFVALVLTFLLLSDVTPWPLPFLKDTGVSCFCCSFCARGSAFVRSDGDVKEFLSVRFQLSCPFLRGLECASKVLLLSVFVSFIHLFTCLLCVFTRQKFHEPMKLVLYSFLPSANMVLLRLYLMVGYPFMLLSSGRDHL